MSGPEMNRRQVLFLRNSQSRGWDGERDPHNHKSCTEYLGAWGGSNYVCVYKGSVEWEVKDSFTEGKLVELTTEHLPSEQAGKGYLGQKEHPVQRKYAVLAHVAPHATFFSLACAIKLQFTRISLPAVCMLTTGRQPRNPAAQFSNFRDEIWGVKC